MQSKGTVLKNIFRQEPDEKMQLHDSSFEYTDCTNKDDGVENLTFAAMEKKQVF
jgi:hypothetical protein